MSYIETRGGQPSRADTYAKLLHHLREAQNQAALMAHLHNTESSEHDKAATRGWLFIEDLIGKMCTQITTLAMGRLKT